MYVYLSDRSDMSLVLYSTCPSCLFGSAPSKPDPSLIRSLPSPLSISVSMNNTGAALASTLHLSAKQLAESWEACSLNRNLTTLDERTFHTYRQAVIKDNDGVAAELLLNGNGNDAAVVSRPSLGGNTTKGSMDGLPAVTPPAKRVHQNAASASIDNGSGSKRVSLSPYPPNLLQTKSAGSNSPKYSERSSAGKVVFTYEPSELEGTEAMEIETQSEPAQRCNISYDFDTNVQKPYRHMFTTLQERAQALDVQLEELGHSIQERYGLGVDGEISETTGIAGLEAVGVPRQEKVCCIGRICNAVR